MDFNYYAPAVDILAPARRAGIGLFVLAAFCMLCGACVGVAAWVGPIDRVIQQLQQAGYQFPATGGEVSPEQVVRFAFAFMSVLGVLLGIALIVLGIFVRRGGKGAAITSLVICIPLVLLTLLDLVRSVPMVLNTPVLLPGVLVGLIPLVLLGLVVTWLIQAIRAAPHLAAQQQQMMAQMWQYQQQQAAYGGYNQAAGSPPPAYGGYAPPPSAPVEPGAPNPPADGSPGAST